MSAAGIDAVDVQRQIEELWEARDELDSRDPEPLRVVRHAVDLLDQGRERVASVEPDGEVVVREWLKKAVLLAFRLLEVQIVEVGPFEYTDRIPLKRDFASAGVRVVPGGIVRWGAFLDRGVIVMPGYVNIGAYVGANSMVDTWATVGSCAQIGANVHLSGGVGIGGVLEPPQSAPVIVEDDAFIGSRSMVTEGARVGRGALLGQGAVLSGSIPVIDAETGDELSRGVVPAWCVAVGATRTRRYPGGEWGLPCILVVKRLPEGVRHEKARLESLVRDHGFAL